MRNEKMFWYQIKNKKGSKNFFFEKKKQKTFGPLDRAGSTAYGPD
jgi:hypothetical protein